MLNNSALRIEWDDSNKKEIEEAKAIYRKARSEGRVVMTADETRVVECFRPNLLGLVIKEVELAPSQFSFRILDETGDRRLIWNAQDPDQVKEAASIFSTYSARGWRAYAVDTTGKQKRRIHDFNADKQEILFEEISIAEIMDNFVEKVKSEKKAPILKTEKLDAFAKKFKKTTLNPSTYPG